MKSSSTSKIPSFFVIQSLSLPQFMLGFELRYPVRKSIDFNIPRKGDDSLMTLYQLIHDKKNNIKFINKNYNFIIKRNCKKCQYQKCRKYSNTFINT